jgi:hypothetical protein
MSERGDNERVLTDEERARALLEQLKGVHAVDVARDLALGLVNFCSPKLGLSDETRAIRDLEDVRLSIELLRAVVNVLDAEGAKDATHDLHDALAQLQLAYAHAVQLANAERAGGHAAPPAGGGPEAAAGGPGEPAETAAAPAADAADAAEPPDEGAGPAEESAAAGTADQEPSSGKKAPAARKKAPAARKKAPAARKKPTNARKKPAEKKSPAKKPPAGED